MSYGLGVKSFCGIAVCKKTEGKAKAAGKKEGSDY